MTSWVTRLLALLLISGLTAGLIAGVFVWQWLHTETPVAAERIVVVEKGTSLQRVAEQLTVEHDLRWPEVWRLYARFLEPKPIRAGEYRLADMESPVSILRRLQSGDVITYQVTLVEGLTYNDYLRTLAQAPRLQALLPVSDLAGQLELLDLDIDHPEGEFFPDTYTYIAGATDVSILRRAHQRMRSTLEREWLNRSEGLPYASAREALIMASLIERETGVEYERATIAGVFVRRLQKGMRLQTDPTVIYGMGSDYQGKITRSHLRQPTPYNTYVIKGLPPTPIAMPGLAAIHAALHPAPGETLFFVAKGDGSHHFSETLEEHNRAVQRYQLKRATDYRSTPGSGRQP